MAVATSTKLNLVNKDAAKFFINPSPAISGKATIKNDMKKIINEIDAIKKQYNTLAKDKSTKGVWKETAQLSVKKAKAYKSNLNTVSSKLESKIDSAIISYIISQIEKLTQAQTAAGAIGTSAGDIK